MTARSRVLCAVAMTAALVASSAPAMAAPACNSGTAARLEKRLPVTPFDLGKRLGQTKCSDFTGDGRKDIVFTGWEYMNHGAHYWAAFRATKKHWVRVKFKRGCCKGFPKNGAGIAIKRSGKDIIVSQPVYASDDPACCPSGGTKTGTWRWGEGRLALVDVTRET